MTESLSIGVHRFNSSFYAASVTVIPIFFITLAVEVRAANSPILRRMVALYLYRKLRRFESLRERMRWLIRGLLLLLTALLPVVTALGWVAELMGLISLDKGSISGSAHAVVLVGVIALPTVVLLWAIAIREREPTPIDTELDKLSKVRLDKIAELGEVLESMEADTSDDRASDQRDIDQVRRRLAGLTRQNRRLKKPTGKARRALRALQDRD
jgi:hypothetical protein